MDLRQGIIETAQSLGMDPLDLATIISYETGGTFDPEQPGPTTQWGQHRGLIQFGEPQAREYGVDWNDPVGSQLGPDGAVARYFRNTGYEPGMGLLDAYSAVNAGYVGRYGASDANNGGAPGDVRDKVTNQMAGHRRNALALLGGEAPSQGQAPGGSPQQPYSGAQTPTQGGTGQNPENRMTALMALLNARPDAVNMLDPSSFQMRAPSPQTNQLASLGFDRNTNPFLGVM